MRIEFKRDDARVDYLCRLSSSAARNRSSKITCAELIFRRATSSEKKAAWSISENFCCLPEYGGHSISNVFDFSLNESGRSPAKAQAWTVLPPFCFIDPSSIHSPDGLMPSSSSNSI